MPANSADCRERAQRCAKLAAAAATPELAAVLSDIAQKWAVLAAELDRTDRALASWQMAPAKTLLTPGLGPAIPDRHSRESGNPVITVISGRSGYRMARSSLGARQMSSISQWDDEDELFRA
jgi:hypothetical protein